MGRVEARVDDRDCRPITLLADAVHARHVQRVLVLGTGVALLRRGGDRLLDERALDALDPAHRFDRSGGNLDREALHHVLVVLDLGDGAATRGHLAGRCGLHGRANTLLDDRALGIGGHRAALPRDPRVAFLELDDDRDGMVRFLVGKQVAGRRGRPARVVL